MRNIILKGIQVYVSAVIIIFGVISMIVMLPVVAIETLHKG